jgi:hypothetical protein
MTARPPLLTVVRGREHDFRQVGDAHYQLSIGSLGVQFTVDRLRRERNELIGELSVKCDMAGARTVDGFLSIADFNLSSAQARTTRAKILIERSEAPDIDWVGLLEELCQKTITAERSGSPSRLLHTFDRPGADVVHDVDGWPLLREHMTILFADGGGLKSYLALHAGGSLAQRGVQVLYVDWELGGPDHRDRLERLFGAEMPNVHYLRCDRPLVDEADRISREVRRLSIDYWIGDSVGFGTAGPPEGAEYALAYCRAVRQIGLGNLQLAHINRSETGDSKPFGSSFWHNSARATWFAKQASVAADGRRLTVGLFNRKSNLTRLSPAIGFEFWFDDKTTAVRRVDLAEVADLAVQLPVWQRVSYFLRSGPRTIAEIAEELEVDPDTVRKAVSPKRGRATFVSVPAVDGKTRIALAERRPA